ncbi:MAG: Rpn family recombination-promoting nuclease/putative transposase [Treponema sp.]|nr:Rpn family recombination-promoting nuclease/putative transposase [Treponema sp.]
MEVKLRSLSELEKLETSELERECRRLRVRFKPVEELTFADDFLFGALMYRREVCRGVIERLLGIRAGRITYPELQKVINPFYDSKGIRLDVLARDGKTLYNIEMQTAAHASLPLRMRYYQGLLDMDLLMKGQDYGDLCQGYVIFICRADPFDRKLPAYTFENTCLEDSSLRLGDKSQKIFYNVSAWESDCDGERRSLLRYIDSGSATSAFTRRLEELSQEVKGSNKFRRQYMMQNIYINDAIYQGREMGRAEGIATGMERGAEQATRNNILAFYKNNASVSLIASSVGKTEAEVLEIIRQGQTEAASR